MGYSVGTTNGLRAPIGQQPGKDPFSPALITTKSHMFTEAAKIISLHFTGYCKAILHKHDSSRITTNPSRGFLLIGSPNCSSGGASFLSQQLLHIIAPVCIKLDIPPQAQMRDPSSRNTPCQVKPLSSHSAIEM